jgi:hypothetical protein
VNPRLLLLALAGFASCATAADASKPPLYNRVHGKVTELDKMIEAAYAPKFNLISVPDDKETFYGRPEAREGGLPNVARMPDGKLLGGYVMLGYVITAEGRATEPVVLETTDERLNATAIKAIDEWRFAPGAFEGKAVAVTAAQEFRFHAPPAEFVTQVLEPTGGKIERPKDWFYTERHGGPKYSWILSKESISEGKPYVTGMRIECLSNIKEGTGKSPKQFILDFMQSKKDDAKVKILNTCEPKEHGLFTRVCLETEEGPYRLLYSLFWGSNEADIAVVTTSGTRRELWEVYAPTFEKMRGFELIDMKRFEDQLKKKE